MQHINLPIEIIDKADNIYPYGSRIYGTNDQFSDYDYIVVGNFQKMENTNITFYSEEEFQQKLDSHDISVLECIFLDKSLCKQSKQFKFDLNLSKLRVSISSKSSNSWVKCKKKFTVFKDKNIYIGKKSLFHSIRIIDFGIQIAKFSKIMNYSCSNYLWLQIKNNNSEDYFEYKEIYQPIYNKKMSEFRSLAVK